MFSCFVSLFSVAPFYQKAYLGWFSVEFGDTALNDCF